MVDIIGHGRCVAAQCFGKLRRLAAHIAEDAVPFAVEHAVKDEEPPSRMDRLKAAVDQHGIGLSKGDHPLPEGADAVLVRRVRFDIDGFVR